MEILVYCALIKQMIETNLQKSKIPSVKDFIFVHMQNFLRQKSQKLWFEN